MNTLFLLFLLVLILPEMNLGTIDCEHTVYSTNMSLSDLRNLTRICSDGG